jgi:hypothetical protein
MIMVMMMATMISASITGQTETVAEARTGHC